MRQEQEQNADENVFQFHANDFGFALSEKQLSDADKYRFLTAFYIPRTRTIGRMRVALIAAR